MAYNNQPCWEKQSQDARTGLFLDIKFNRSTIDGYIYDYLLGNEFKWDEDFREEQFHTEIVAGITNSFNSFDCKLNMDNVNTKITELIEEYVEDKWIIGIDDPDSDTETEAFENPPICCGVGKSNDCDKPCDKKYIGNKKSEMWGETDEFAKHPYHWNLCEDCFKKESGDSDSDSDTEEEVEKN